MLCFVMFFYFSYFYTLLWSPLGSLPRIFNHYKGLWSENLIYADPVHHVTGAQQRIKEHITLKFIA